MTLNRLETVEQRGHGTYRKMRISRHRIERQAAGHNGRTAPRSSDTFSFPCFPVFRK